MKYHIPDFSQQYLQLNARHQTLNPFTLQRQIQHKFNMLFKQVKATHNVRQDIQQLTPSWVVNIYA